MVPTEGSGKTSWKRLHLNSALKDWAGLLLESDERAWHPWQSQRLLQRPGGGRNRKRTWKMASVCYGCCSGCFGVGWGT